MLKPTVALLFVSTTALAGAPPQQHTPSPVTFKLTVKAASDTRVYELRMIDDDCGSVNSKASAYEDEIGVCTRATPQGVVVKLKWKTRTSTSEYKSETAVVMTKGGHIDMGSKDTRFTIAMQ